MPEKARSQNRETAPELQAILDSSEVARHDARRTMAEVIVSQSILALQLSQQAQTFQKMGHDEMGDRYKHIALRMSTKVLECLPHAQLTIEEHSLVNAKVEKAFGHLAFERL